MAEVTQWVELGFEPRPIRPGAQASFTALSASQEVGPVPPGVQDGLNHPRPAAGSPQFNGGGVGETECGKQPEDRGREDGADGTGQTLGERGA